MTTKSKHKPETFESRATNNQKKHTRVVELSGELSAYPHCKLPEHYFDLLLYKKQQIIPGVSDSQWSLPA